MVPQPDLGSPPTPIPSALARQLGLGARRFLGVDERNSLSAAIVERLLGLEALSSASAVAGYLALADEVDPAAAMAAVERRGGAVHLPRLRDNTLDFVAWSDGDPLEENSLGIGEPAGPAVPLGSLDAVVLPCVAVDDAGTRVGFGAGYYDRSLEGVLELGDRPLLVGLAFEVQCLAAIERQEWDVPLDLVVTESRTIECA